MQHRKEKCEGPTSNMGLLNNLDVPPVISAPFNVNSAPVIVFFDLETGGFQKNADILQIAAKCNDKSLSIYIKPAAAIAETASNVNGLRFVRGELEYRGSIVESISLKDAMHAFYKFLFVTG